MFESMAVKWIWDNKQIILMAVGAAVIAGLIWWGFIRNPQVIKAQNKQITDLQEQVEASKQAAAAVQTIGIRKDKIDANIQAQITSLHHRTFPRRTSGVFLPSGQL